MQNTEIKILSTNAALSPPNMAIIKLKNKKRTILIGRFLINFFKEIKNDIKKFFFSYIKAIGYSIVKNPNNIIYPKVIMPIFSMQERSLGVSELINSINFELSFIIPEEDASMNFCGISTKWLIVK